MDENLLRFKPNQKYLCFDFETESLNLRYARPWQIFWAIYQNNKELRKHNLYIKWDNIKVSKDAARITGFDLAFYEKHAEPKEQVLELFDQDLYNKEYLIVGANIINYDAMIHNLWRRECGKKTDYSWLQRLRDTNCLSRAYKKGLKKPHNSDWLTWQFQLNNLVERGLRTSVSTMAKEFNLPFDPATLHQAQNDVPLTYQIFRKLNLAMEIE